MSATRALPANATRSRLPISFASVRSSLPTGATLARAIALGLIALAAVVTIWSRFSVLNNSLWGDEAFSVVRYVGGGPAVIWDPSKWFPNDHVLWEVLTWATTRIIGSHIEAADRIWSVFPALAGGALMTWWLWQRIDRWAAVIFAVAAAVTPMYFDLGTQARGYGIGFLAASLIVVAGDRVKVGGSRTALALFALGGFAGIATLQNFFSAFLAAGAVLALDRRLRRRVVIAVVVVGVASIGWYGPLLSKAIGHQNPHGQMLAWYGFATTPVRDLYGLQVNTLAPAVSVTAGAVIGTVALLVGAVALWRRQERTTVGLLVVPVLATYFLIELAAKYNSRFGSFALLPTLALAAIGMAAAGRLLALTRVARIALVALLAACALVVLGHFVQYAARITQVPFESAKNAGVIIRGTDQSDPRELVLSNTGAAGAFDMAVRPRHVRVLPAAQLESMFCTERQRFIYIEQALFKPHPSTACLQQRGGFRIALPERRSKAWTWLVPALKRGS